MLRQVEADSAPFTDVAASAIGADDEIASRCSRRRFKSFRNRLIRLFAILEHKARGNSNCWRCTILIGIPGAIQSLLAENAVRIWPGIPNNFNAARTAHNAYKETAEK